MRLFHVIVLMGFSFNQVQAYDQKITYEQKTTWSQGEIINEPRTNPYSFTAEEFHQYRRLGQWAAHDYPVTVTGLLPPYRPIIRVLNDDFKNPIKKWLNSLFKSFTQVTSFDELMLWLGLNPFPEASEQGPYSVYLPEGKSKPKFIGVEQMERQQAQGFSLSCATCHTSQLFGKTVFGLTNRFPRANDFFIRAKQGVQLLDENFFKYYSGANRYEMELFSSAKENIKAVGLKKPLALGLDTSLAQVALSLNRRSKDSIASKSEYFEKHPRYDYLDDIPADSKPAVWWNVKYKNRWLSDGSVVSGNPIYTNILWNEIGRGVDVVKLEEWLQQNEKKIAEIATAVFSSEAPRITDFFSEDEFDIQGAQRGEKVFNDTCSRCHGTYKKNWSLPEADRLSLEEKIKNAAVYYPKQTKVKDVGTDPYRYLGMVSLEKLNDLDISKKNNILIKAQKGYVPPPLVGIWARWPYLHNNSIPSLCELLKPANQRVKFFYQGPAQNKETDFDKICNGYPLPEKAPMAWRKNKELKFDTLRKGLGNFGHDEGIIVEDGKELLSSAEKIDLIKYLQTL